MTRGAMRRETFAAAFLSPVLLLCFASGTHCSASARGNFGPVPGGPSTDAGSTIFTDARVRPVDAAPSAKMLCSVPPDEENGGGLECTQSAPPDSFTPKRKWAWTEEGSSSIVTPLVANLDDDDGNGVVDLCDVPDVIVTLMSGEIVMLAGDTGALQRRFKSPIDGNVTPAIADLDSDGEPEVIANDPTGHLVAFNGRGGVKWVGPDVGTYKSQSNAYCHAIAVYDLDGDGEPEIIAGFEVFDHKGKRKFGHTPTSTSDYWCPANTAADLDGDGKLEAILGNAAYRADGSLYWTLPGPPGQPQVGNLDDDDDPEVFYARQDGIVVVEHDGTLKYGPLRLIDEPTSPNCWSKPGAIHDFDGDGRADLSASTCLAFGVYRTSETGITLNWSSVVNDTSGLASTTAFDFLGRGVAQAVYGDQVALYVFDGKTGKVNLTAPRSSGTLIEYPVVADIDNDQSADIVVVSNGGSAPTVQAWQDAQSRWIPTRRIWNQHAYHVTNVREDGTIPKVMGKSWQRLNTFRTNTQISGNADCTPPVVK